MGLPVVNKQKKMVQSLYPFDSKLITYTSVRWAPQGLCHFFVVQKPGRRNDFCKTRYGIKGQDLRNNKQKA
jgi:hypothetical protein